MHLHVHEMRLKFKISLTRRALYACCEGVPEKKKKAGLQGKITLYTKYTFQVHFMFGMEKSPNKYIILDILMT